MGREGSTPAFIPCAPSDRRSHRSVHCRLIPKWSRAGKSGLVRKPSLGPEEELSRGRRSHPMSKSVGQPTWAGDPSHMRIRPDPVGSPGSADWDDAAGRDLLSAGRSVLRRPKGGAGRRGLPEMIPSPSHDDSRLETGRLVRQALAEWTGGHPSQPWAARGVIIEQDREGLILKNQVWCCLHAIMAVSGKNSFSAYMTSGKIRNSRG